ncbi:InlB B-repeat-containing protein [Bifidobacterium adolescentis]|uniref:InlB B-repeat-containing protein n=2 Tax=Bifidobacterium adolescentis TaxID=1680 RepID=UPI0011064EE4|nr:InlB B-repeat-containing protein [Bifidobacterium adolescentis]MDB0644776.1 InlB B-repeat-containing protein [Bifidobacterium adolescentis]
MGFLTRLLAGLTAAAALGTGLTGTANAVDVTGAAGTTKSVVKLADDGGNETSEDTADNPDDDSTDADSTTDAGAQSDAGQQAEIQSSTSQDKATAKSSLPDHIVNGSFDYPACPDGKNSCDVDPTTGWGGFYVDYGRKFMPIPDWDRSKFGWDSSQEGLRPDQQPNSHQKLQHCVQIGNKPNNNGQKMNRFAEIIAETPDEYIYQDIATTPGVMYRWSLKHASEDASHVDSMQVMIGSPGRETAQDATRTTSNGRGDRTGVTSKTIATKGGQAEWETYTGVYVATSTVTRFTFKSAQGRDSTRGNFIDDVMFTKAYKLTYDKNSADASGQVPSNQRGKENTTQPAKTKTNGKIRLASDTSKLSDHLINSDFEYLPDGGWKTISARYDMASAYTSVDPNNGQYIRNARHAESDTGTAWVDWDGFDSSRFAWRTDQKGGQDQGGLKDRANAVELQQDSTDGNTYAEMVASETGRTIYQDLATIPGTLYKIRLKHASLCKDNVDKMQVVINGTPIEMTRVTANGKAGDKVGEKSTTIATKVTNENRWHHADQWETYEGYYVIPDGQTTTRFGFKAVNYLDPTKGNLLDDVTFARAYKLSYDKNSTDATGEVPSNQRGKENTTQPAKTNSGDASGSVPSDTAANTVKQAKTKTNGSVRLASDDVATYAANGLPKQLVNSDFDHDWRNIVTQSKMSAKYNFANIDPAHGDVEVSGPLNGKGEASKQWVHLNGFDANKFGWKSNQTDTRVDGRGGIVEIQRSRANDNMYAEITASQAGTYLYQDIDTAHDYPTVYTVKLRYAHRNGTINSNEKIQILVGAPGHEQPVEMTRIASDRGNRLGEKSTTVNAPNTDGWLGSWDTFQGSVVVPAGQNVSRFTFKALGSIDGISGNLIDDVQFKLAYKLSYDKNANDAYGQVPSDTTANTVKQAKTRTTGSVRTVADRTASGLTVHDLKKGDIAPAQYGDFKFSTTDGVTADQITDVNGFTVKKNWDPTEENQAYAGILATMYQPNKNGASLVLHHVGQWRDSSGTQRWLNAKITVNDQNLGSLVYLESKHEFRASYGKWDKHPSSRPYMDVTVDFLLDDGSTPQGLRGATGFTDLDGGTSGYNEGVELVSGFDGAYVRSDAHLARFGTNSWAGTTDENKNNADAHGMKHYVGATFTGSSFHVRWSVASGQARQSGFQPVDSTIAYRLTYNKNAQDATGSIPSDTAANTTQPAKSETDGKVSDLVQRTTTHEDGSVTVRTVDQSTDVVSGCQVYYPAGQRITLATMAKDDDCWDSSMLSRPGHTQLGWNQDRNATQAQAEVTMVEGGMTVYAVWVGNPVLTYDTNKPSTWTGEMPSTPASVSVPYNTAAADGSGWQAGDVSKIKGYRFLGWYTTPQDGSNLYDWNTPLTGSVTVYAHWQRLQANVIYNANGGTGSHPNTTGWQYSDVTIPGDTSKSFKRDKYVFKGWGTKPGKADVVYKDGSKVALQDKDITLYAQWQEVHENFVETGGIGLPIAIAGGVLLLMFGIGSTVMLTRRMNGHGMPDDE